MDTTSQAKPGSASNPTPVPDSPKFSYGRQAQSEIYKAGVVGELPKVPVDVQKLEAAAKQKLSPQAYAYIACGAGQERTLKANSAAFSDWQIYPRVLRDVSERDLSIELLGKKRATPFLLAPIGVAAMAHPEADLAIARAAKQLEVPYILSHQASYPMEQTAQELDGSAHWFQLYWSSSAELVASTVKRAEASGAEAIVVTLDTHILGWRTQDLDLGFLPFTRGQGLAQYTSDPVFLELVKQRVAAKLPKSKTKVTATAIKSLLEISKNYPGSTFKNLRSPLGRAAVETFLEVFSKPSLNWKELSFLREQTKLPIFLKGILHPDDAKTALDHEVDGLIVSNHGGRQVDGAIPTITALPEIVKTVDREIPIIFDSGIRGGADAFKALALGADAVAIGRPYVYGLALAGTQGVVEVVRNLIAEFDITLGLSGHTRVSELSPAALRKVN